MSSLEINEDHPDENRGGLRRACRRKGLSPHHCLWRRVEGWQRNREASEYKEGRLRVGLPEAGGRGGWRPLTGRSASPVIHSGAGPASLLGPELEAAAKVEETGSWGLIWTAVGNGSGPCGLASEVGR